MAPLTFLFDTRVPTGTGSGVPCHDLLGQACPPPSHYEITLVPHALAILCAGVYLGLLALVCWWELRKCKCGKEDN